MIRFLLVLAGRARATRARRGQGAATRPRSPAPVREDASRSRGNGDSMGERPRRPDRARRAVPCVVPDVPQPDAREPRRRRRLGSKYRIHFSRPGRRTAARSGIDQDVYPDAEGRSAHLHEARASRIFDSRTPGGWFPGGLPLKRNAAASTVCPPRTGLLRHLRLERGAGRWHRDPGRARAGRGGTVLPQAEQAGEALQPHYATAASPRSALTSAKKSGSGCTR